MATIEQISTIVKMKIDGRTLEQISAEVGLHPTTVSRLQHNENYQRILAAEQAKLSTLTRSWVAQRLASLEGDPAEEAVFSKWQMEAISFADSLAKECKEGTEIGEECLSKAIERIRDLPSEALSLDSAIKLAELGLSLKDRSNKIRAQLLGLERLIKDSTKKKP